MWDFIKNLFNAIISALKQAFKAVANALGPLLPFLIVLTFLLLPVLGPIVAGWGFTTLGAAMTTLSTTLAGMGTYAALAMGVGTAALLMPSETGELVARVVEVASDIISGAASITGSAIGAILESLPSWLIWGAAATAVYLLVREDSPSQITLLTDKVQGA
jgi:phage-related protein